MSTNQEIAAQIIRDALEASPGREPCGIDIAGMARQAAEQGQPKKGMLVCLEGGAHISYEVGADGSVTVLTEGYRALVEDGQITGFQAV